VRSTRSTVISCSGGPVKVPAFWTCRRSDQVPCGLLDRRRDGAGIGVAAWMIRTPAAVSVELLGGRSCLVGRR
jgi:hypothetical protein